MTQLDQSLKQLYSRRTFGIKLGLQTEQTMLELLGNPQTAYAVIHIAGTNGKGSVCAMLASILRAAGIMTGLYTSPHLVRFNERFVVDGIPINDEELAPLVARIEQISRTVSEQTGNDPTFFECSTAIAFEYFRIKEIQVAVLETGMGGRLDATNVCVPLVSVITRVSMEHTEHLGPDIQSISAEKAGIIRQGVPVVCGATDETALEVIRQTAFERNASFLYVPDHVSARVVDIDTAGQKISVESAFTSYGVIHLPLIGSHQVENLCTAVAATEMLAQAIGVEAGPDLIKNGVAATQWPGRFQTISVDPPVILDGAHNPGAGEALAKAIGQVFKGRPIGLVLGMCGDKDVLAFLRPFAAIVKMLWVVPLQNERNMEYRQIAAAAESLGLRPVPTTLSAALEESKHWAVETRGAVCIAGSLFLVGEILGR